MKRLLSHNAIGAAKTEFELTRLGRSTRDEEEKLDVSQGKNRKNGPGAKLIPRAREKREERRNRAISKAYAAPKKGVHRKGKSGISDHKQRGNLKGAVPLKKAKSVQQIQSRIVRGVKAGMKSSVSAHTLPGL